MAVDPFLQMYDAGELKVAAEFLTNWLPFLAGDLCDCCSATLRCRIGSLGSGSAPPAISSSDLTCASPRGFVVTGWDADPSPVPTGWDTEPERSSGYDKTPPSSERVGPTDRGTEPERTSVPIGWESGLVQTPSPTGWDSDSVQTPAPAPTGWDFESERTPAPTGWDSGLEKTPEPTGWFTETAVVPTGWDVEPEIPIGPSAPAQGGEKVRMSWADMAQEEDELEEEEEARRSERILAPTGWDSGLEKTPEPTGWFTEMAVVLTGRDVKPEIPIGPSAPAQGGEKVRMLSADMAQEEDELEEARRSERTPAPTGWDSRLEKAPELIGWFTEMAVVPTGWDVEPEIPIGPSAPARRDEKVRISWADMVEEEEEEARRSERTPAPTGWDSGLEKTPEPTGWFTEMAVVPTGRDVEPEIPIGPSAPTHRGEMVRMSWADMAQEEDELEEEEEARRSERTPVPTGWDSGLEKTPELTGWFTEMAVVPTGRDVEPEIPIGPSAPAQRGEKVRMSWADMAQEEDELEEEEEARRSERTPAPTGWDSGLEKTPELTGWFTEMAVVPTGWDVEPEIPIGPSAPAHGAEKVRMSWADIAQEEDELEEKEEARRSESSGEKKKPELSRDQREQIRFGNVQRKDFICLERIKGKVVNVLQGLELHTGVFSAAEQKRIVDLVYELQKKGQNRELGEHTYSKPKKWMRGKGRETIQFGCAYSYAKKNGNLPGILRNVNADPLPHLFKEMIRRLVRWHVLPASCVPDSCIVNIYEPEDCIPPHVDSHDFVRPFCTVSFLSECNILFGSELKIAGPGEFTGSFSIPLPVGSVLVLNGNSSDVAKHCVPAVPTKRISITFRRMDERKRPTDFVPESDLLSILPLPYEIDEVESNDHIGSAGSRSEQQMNGSIKGEVLRGKSVYKFHQGHSSALGTSSHQDGDSEMSMSRGRNSVGRWFEPKTDRGLLGAPPYRADAHTSRQWLQEEGSASWIGRSQQSGGFRMIAGEEESACAPEVGELLINMRYGGELSRRQFSLSSVKVQ